MNIKDRPASSDLIFSEVDSMINFHSPLKKFTLARDSFHLEKIYLMEDPTQITQSQTSNRSNSDTRIPKGSLIGNGSRESSIIIPSTSRAIEKSGTLLSIMLSLSCPCSRWRASCSTWPEKDCRLTIAVPSLFKGTPNSVTPSPLSGFPYVPTKTSMWGPTIRGGDVSREWKTPLTI